MTQTVARRTLVAFHAHPDDEALLTAGTMARAAAQAIASSSWWPRTALWGWRRPTTAGRDSGRSGVARRWRAPPPSASPTPTGWGTPIPASATTPSLTLRPPPPTTTAGATRRARSASQAPLGEAADRLADILVQERADVLLSYDANGGYGHRDHVKVHEVGALAAVRAGTPRVLEATIPRDLIVRAIRLSAKVYPYPPEFDPDSFTRAYTARREITHRIDVHRYAARKRAAMRAHASQASADGGDRHWRRSCGSRAPFYDAIFGREWYRDPAHPPGAPIAGCLCGVAVTEVEAAAQTWRPTWRTVVQMVVGFGLSAVILIWGLPHFAKTSWGEVWAIVSRLSWRQSAGFCRVGAAGPVELYLHPDRLDSRPVPPARVHRQHGRIGREQCLPGGGAVGLAATFAICRSGFGKRVVSTSAIVTGVWNTLARMLLPIIAIAGLAVGSSHLPPLMLTPPRRRSSAAW